MANVIHGHGNGTVCFRGTVQLNLGQQGIGATNGRLVSDRGFSIQIRQVPGPNNQGIPLADVNNQFVTVCGNFIFDGGRVLLNVSAVFPSQVR